MSCIFNAFVNIHATPAIVWQVLTDPRYMLQWMGEESMELSIETDWLQGSIILIRGTHHLPFENRGTVLECIPEQQLSYTQLSSISCLPDEPESYTRLDFELRSDVEQTILQLEISNFPTVSIQKHLEFYWRTTLIKIKKYAEQHQILNP